MEILILGHVIGDFYLQNNKIAEKKKKSKKYMLLHCGLYGAIMYFPIWILNRSIERTLWIVFLVALSHLVIDWNKIKCDKKFSEYEHVIFGLDQIIHLFILFIIFFAEKNEGYIQLRECWMINIWSVDIKVIRAILAMLICCKPSAIFISLIFKRIPNTVETADKDQANPNIGNESIKIGSWIGILEREIILILGLLGQYGAIGFVLTAKSVARFNQLEKKAFAEKYLVGTLLSTLIALACSAFCTMNIAI